MSGTQELSDFINGLIDPSNSEKLSAEDLDNLSMHELEALAGLHVEDVEKMAGMLMDCMPGDRYGSWLDQFDGTPLHAKALALCETELQLEAERIRRRQESQDQDLWTKQDELRLNKDMLTLELHKHKSQATAGQGKDPTMVPPPAPKAPKAEPAAPAEEKTSALLDAVKRANDVQTTGQVNNGDPSNPEWPTRSSTGIDSAGRRATPEELEQQKDTATPQHVAPATSGTHLPHAAAPKTASLLEAVKTSNMHCLPDGSGFFTATVGDKTGKTGKKKIAKAEREDVSVGEGALRAGTGAGVGSGFGLPGLGGAIGGSTAMPKRPWTGALAGAGGGMLGHAAGRAAGEAAGIKDPELQRALTTVLVHGGAAAGAGGLIAAVKALVNHLEDKPGKKKESGDLSTAAREDLGKKQFALPEQRKFPIPDEAHARNALARAAQFGSPAVQAKVRAAVAKHFPGVGLTSASKPEQPTVKKTITKTSSTKLGYQAVGGFPGNQLVGGVTQAAKKVVKKAVVKTSGRKLNAYREDLAQKLEGTVPGFRNPAKPPPVPAAAVKLPPMHPAGAGMGRAGGAGLATASKLTGAATRKPLMRVADVLSHAHA